MKKQYEEQAEKKRLKKKSIIAIVLIIFMIGVIAGISKIADSRSVGVTEYRIRKKMSLLFTKERRTFEEKYFYIFDSGN